MPACPPSISSMRYFIALAYSLAALIHLTPALGVFSNDVLNQLYDIEVASSEMSLLLRHRAVLFAIVGGLLLTAAFKSHLRTCAGIIGLVSMASFIALHQEIGTDNESLFRVAIIDGIVTLVLAAGVGLHLGKHPGR